MSRIARKLARRKRRIIQRLKRTNDDKYRRSAAGAGPVIDVGAVKYELADKARGIANGGGVLKFAINALCGATCLQDIELRRHDEVFWDAIGADAIPDPTTAGDFCRRFDESALRDLHHAIDDARLNVWKRQSPDFFDEAVIDRDGTLVVTTGECKAGMEIS